MDEMQKLLEVLAEVKDDVDFAQEKAMVEDGIIDLEVLPAVLDLPPVESVALGQVGGDREGLSALGQVHPAGFAVADHDEDILEVEVVGPRVGAGFALGPEPALLCLRRRLGPPV